MDRQREETDSNTISQQPLAVCRANNIIQGTTHRLRGPKVENAETGICCLGMKWRQRRGQREREGGVHHQHHGDREQSIRPTAGRERSERAARRMIFSALSFVSIDLANERESLPHLTSPSHRAAAQSYLELACERDSMPHPARMTVGDPVRASVASPAATSDTDGHEDGFKRQKSRSRQSTQESRPTIHLAISGVFASMFVLTS